MIEFDLMFLMKFLIVLAFGFTMFYWGVNKGISVERFVTEKKKHNEKEIE